MSDPTLARGAFQITAAPAYEEADAAYAIEELTAGRASYWDALLVSACGRAGCGVLFTEDTQGSPVSAGVRIVNPFAVASLLSVVARELLDL